jgi:hypothetical protein
MKVTWIDNQALLSWNAPPQPDIKQYRVWKKGVLGLGAAPLGNTDGTEFALHATNVGAKLNVQISSIDVDGLESQRSEPLEIRR